MRVIANVSRFHAIRPPIIIDHETGSGDYLKLLCFKHGINYHTTSTKHRMLTQEDETL